MGLLDSISSLLNGISEHAGADQIGSLQDLAQGDLSALTDLAQDTPLAQVTEDGQALVESATQAQQDIVGP